MCCKFAWNVRHPKLHYCLRHSLYVVYIDQRILYEMPLYLRSVCIIFLPAYVYVLMCIYVHVFLCTCVHACMRGCKHKVLICAGRHKARPRHPPLPLPWGGGGGCGDGGDSLSICFFPAGEGGLGPDWRLWRWWGGDSLAVFMGWMCRLGV